MTSNKTFQKKNEESVMLYAVNTARVQAIPARNDHLEAVELVFRENHETCALLSAHPDSYAEALSLVTYAELPPQGMAENLRNFVLFDRESDQPMGVLSLYLGYPDPNMYYIGSLYLRPDWQRDGYGRELMQELEQQLQREGYAAGRVAVGLKNWPALRFWTKQGYDTVTMIGGNRMYAADYYAVIELQKNL